MTSAELKTIREAIGLSVSDLAVLVNVQERTVRYWESGQRSVPDDVRDLVVSIDDRLTCMARQAVEVLRVHAVSMGLPESVVLVRYREAEDLWHYRPDMRPLPVTTHAALLARCRAALADMHVCTRIVYMEPAEYSQWLADRPDSEATRAEWAALKGSDHE